MPKKNKKNTTEQPSRKPKKKLGKKLNKRFSKGAKVTNQRSGIVLALSSLVAYLAMGASFYINYEGWAPVDAFYFCIVSLSTTGYGDLQPSSPETKLFTIAYLFIGLGLMVGAVSVIVDEIQRILNLPQGGSCGGSSSLLMLLLGALLRIGLMMGVGSVWFHQMEGMAPVDAFYLAAISITTVGYDAPSSFSPSTRVFLCVYLVIGMTHVGQIFGSLAEVFQSAHAQDKLSDELDTQLERLASGELTVEELDPDGNGEIAYADFLEYQLLTLDLLPEESLQRIRKQFLTLDTKRNGSISQQEIAALRKRYRDE